MSNQKLRPYLLYVFIITLVILPVFSASLALPYVSDNLDSVPMREKTIPPGVIPSINYKMVHIPPGTFMMGSPDSEKGQDSDEERHKVILTKGFYMGVTEVTWRL